MEWININSKLPNKYEEVIIATLEGSVKAATHIENGKFSTYLTVTHWMNLPQAPERDLSNDEYTEELVVKKKRGRPKKTI